MVSVDRVRGGRSLTRCSLHQMPTLRWLYASTEDATIEQGKGILMARHAIDQSKAFDMLREHSQRSDRRLIEVAEAIVQSHVLLLPPLSAGESS